MLLKPSLEALELDLSESPPVVEAERLRAVKAPAGPSSAGRERPTLAALQAMCSALEEAAWSPEPTANFLQRPGAPPAAACGVERE